jgi:predicted nucleic acid-binding protein
MPVTFVDAGVLIAAARGSVDVSARAMSILDEPGRTFASSEFVRLEVLPKALFNKKADEADFYTEYFRSVSHWPPRFGALVKSAYDIGVRFGLSAMDSLHVAAALAVGADEFVTTEKRDKPLHRVTDLRVLSIQPDSSP